MKCDIEQDKRMLAALTIWARGSEALSFGALGERLRETGFFEQSPSELEVSEAVEARLGASARAVRSLLSAPYFRGLLARGPSALGEAMRSAPSGAGQARVTPFLELGESVEAERRASRREAGERLGAKEARSLRSERVERDEMPASGARVWAHGAGSIQGRWFWAAWSEGALLALSPLGADPALEGELSASGRKAQERARGIQGRLERAFGEGSERGAREAGARIRAALGARSAMAGGLGAQLSPLGPPAWAAVWTELAKVPSGKVISSAELARRAGLGRRADLARQACEANPIAALIPCHRVAPDEGEAMGEEWAASARSMLLLREFIRSRL